VRRWYNDCDGNVDEGCNTAPSTSGISNVTVNENASNTDIDLWNSFSDAESSASALNYTVQGIPNSGIFSSVSVSGQYLILDYGPAADAWGSDNITIRATDPGSLYAQTSFSVTVSPVNDASPVITQGAGPLSVTIDEDNAPTAFSLTLNATDTDNDTLTWSISSAASHGTAAASGTGTSKVITYTPAADYNNDGVTTDTFKVKVDDNATPDLRDDEITVNVTVNPRNDPPVNTILPTFSGVMFLGETLTVTGDGTWDDNTDTDVSGSSSLTIPFGYQWQRADDNADTNLADITGETVADYVLTSADDGKYVRLKVAVTDTGVGDPAVQTAEAFSDYRGISEIITDAETSVGTTSAQFNGTVRSLGETVSDIRFIPQTLGAGIVYHYRAVATVGGFDIYGDDRTFDAATTELPAPGKALSFDGTDYVTAELATASADNLTFEAYVKWSGGTGQTVVYNGTDGYGISAAVSAVQFAPGSWQHVAVVRDAGTWKLYLNGLERLLIENPTPATPTGTTDIGTDFSGQLDEVRIWNTARTLTEIQDSMFQSLTGTEPDLAAYYHFDHASGTVVTDRTSAHKDGTFVSSLSWTDSAAFTTWTGGVGSWHTAGNWSDGVPGPGSAAGIPSGSPEISAAASCGNLFIGSGATLTLSSGADLTISGDAFNNGTLSATQDSTVTYSGTAEQHVMTGTYGNLTLNNADGFVAEGTLTAAAPLIWSAAHSC